MVGAEGFEPTTPWTQTKCATRLRYAPKLRLALVGLVLNKFLPQCKGNFLLFSFDIPRIFGIMVLPSNESLIG